MIRRHLAALRLALMLADGLSAAVLFVVVAVVRYGTTDPAVLSTSLALDVDRAAILYGLGWVGVLAYLNLYRLRARWTLRAEFRDILRATVLMAAGTLILLFLFKLDVVSRLFLVFLFASQLVWTTLSRAALRAAFSLYRERGYNQRYMLIVGAGEPAQQFADAVESFKPLGLRVIGHLTGPGDERVEVSRPVLGSVEQIADVLHGQIVDEVAVCLTRPDPEVSQNVTALCALEGRNVRIPLQTLTLSQEGRVEEFEGTYVFSLSFGPARALSLLAKQLLDTGLAAAGLVLLSPLLLLIALRIRMADGPPVLFRQTRVGLHGRPFTIYKFRTMVREAEARYAEVAQLSDTKGAAFKMVDDPRVTPLGRLLRRTSLDELPQLINVIKGDMSLVGPRPAPPREVAAYDLWHRRRLSMKPGISGLWQVESQIDEHFDQRAQLDLSYIDRWSLWLDLKILARTIPAVVMRAGR